MFSCSHSCPSKDQPIHCGGAMPEVREHRLFLSSRDTILLEPEVGDDIIEVRAVRGYWFKCYWCEYWWQPRWQQESNVYVICSIGHTLCDRCLDWHVLHHGGPYLPSSIDRTENHLTVVLFRHVAEFPSILIRRVAEFLREWHEP